MKKLEYIIILRALAVLAVLMVHVSRNCSTQFLPPILSSFIDSGVHGVQLFFLISAFTLFLSYSHRNNERYHRLSFFIRRFFRIAPLYYLAIAYYLWQNGFGQRYFMGRVAHVSAGNIISNLLFVHGFNPYFINSIVPGGWSVGVEFIFYAMFPFVFYRVRNIQHACNFVLICLIIRSAFFVIFKHHVFIPEAYLWEQFTYFQLANQLPVFALGILLYFIVYDNCVVHISPITTGLFAIMILLQLCIREGLIIDGLFCYGSAFILLALAFKSYHPRILFNSVILFIGNISYTLYLTQFAAIFFLLKIRAFDLIAGHGLLSAIVSFVFNYLIVLAASILISVPLYYGIERPMQNLGKRLISKISAKPN